MLHTENPPLCPNPRQHDGHWYGGPMSNDQKWCQGRATTDVSAFRESNQSKRPEGRVPPAKSRASNPPVSMVLIEQAGGEWQFVGATEQGWVGP